MFGSIDMCNVSRKHNDVNNLGHQLKGLSKFFNIQVNNILVAATFMIHMQDYAHKHI